MTEREHFLPWKSLQTGENIRTDDLKTQWVTNSIMLFSHTPSSHWGIHCWKEFKYTNHFQKENKKIKVIKQLNKGSNNNNWIICLDEKGCPLHKKICKNNYCSELDESLFEKSLKSILNADS